MAAKREVIVFDNAGVGRSGRNVLVTYQGWANDLISFVRALGIKEFGLLGFSMGGIAVQHVAVTVPGIIRKLVIAGSRAAAPVAHRPVKEGVAEFVKDQPPY